MRLVRVVASRTSSFALSEIGDRSIPLFQCADGDTAIALASWSGRLSGEVGAWLEVGPDYPAQIAARDARTLSVLTDLGHVVIAARDRAGDHADVVRVLLTGEEVSFSSSVATLHHAISRPAPPKPITVWSYDNEQLTSGDVTLRVVRHDDTHDAELTYFEDYSG
jgi:hypothetical protein